MKMNYRVEFNGANDPAFKADLNRLYTDYESAEEAAKSFGQDAYDIMQKNPEAYHEPHLFLGAGAHLNYNVINVADWRVCMKSITPPIVIKTLSEDFDEDYHGFESLEELATFAKNKPDYAERTLLSLDLATGMDIPVSTLLAAFAPQKVKRPTDEQRKLGEEEGFQGFELTHGYVVSDFDCMSIFEVTRVDCMGTFESDEEAVLVAIADGLPIIPVEELPKEFSRRYLGWIDTPENRARIEEVTKMALNEMPYADSNETALASQRAADAYIAKYCV